MLAILEIAIVLCSLFLVTSPVVAAEQTTLEVKTNEVTTASEEDDFVLDVYGNANEDDTIDMRDLTYMKLIFFGKKPETVLADAKYDGKINPLDFIQIKLIIVGKEKEITLIQRLTYKEYERAKTFNLPIKRIIALDDGNGEPIRVLGTEDLVVGVGTSLVTHDILLPEMSKLPIVASGSDVDYEKVLSLKPDFLLAFASWPLKGLEETLEPHGIQVLRLDCMLPTTEIPEDVIKLGYLLGKVDKAEEFAEFHDDIIDMIRTRTEGLSEDEMPRVYFEHRKYQTTSKTWKHGIICNIAGGNNLANDLPSGGIGYSVDPEWVIERNPDILIRTEWGQSGECGYGVDDTTKIKAIRDEIMNRPELANVNAVKNGNVYVISNDLAWSGIQGFVAAAYWAKWFHPDLFEDLDPKAIHQEYIDKFLRIDYDLDKHGVFVYPKPS